MYAPYWAACAGKAAHQNDSARNYAFVYDTIICENKQVWEGDTGRKATIYGVFYENFINH